MSAEQLKRLRGANPVEAARRVAATLKAMVCVAVLALLAVIAVTARDGIVVDASIAAIEAP